MERIRRMVLARAVVAAAISSLAMIGWSGAALASPPTVTLSGNGGNGHSPDSNDADAYVSATLSKRIASGSLDTFGRDERVLYRWFHFTGTVTCMDVDGKHVTVGAFGTTRLEGGGQPEEQLPGTYAQVLTVEFGEIEEPGHEFPVFRSYSFGMLGEANQGVQSNAPPNCNKHYSFAHQIVPTFGVIHISPSITWPRDGHISRRGNLRLCGTGEPNRAIKVYEVGHEATGTEVTADARGKWSLTLTGVSKGTHVFTASAVNGSEVPANTVEVIVKKQRSAQLGQSGPTRRVEG